MPRQITRNIIVGDGDGMIRLTIKIGDGQDGAAAIWVDDELISKGGGAKMKSIKLGKASDLVGKVIQVDVGILHVQQTVHSSATYVFTGVEGDSEFQTDGDFEEEDVLLRHRGIFKPSKE